MCTEERGTRGEGKEKRGAEPWVFPKSGTDQKRGWGKRHPYIPSWQGSKNDTFEKKREGRGWRNKAELPFVRGLPEISSFQTDVSETGKGRKMKAGRMPGLPNYLQKNIINREGEKILKGGTHGARKKRKIPVGK